LVYGTLSSRIYDIVRLIGVNNIWEQEA
jgi:hypothetical protein